jgi:hypothetical protein
MSKANKFDTSKATKIVRIIGAVADRTSQVRSMREALAGEFKGFPRKPLDDTAYNMVRDAAVKDLTARGTVGEKSIGPMATKQAKVAKWMPVILGIPADKLGAIGDNYERLAALGTQLNDHSGNVDKALHALLHKAKDYKKASASHFKALLSMKDGKFFTPKQKAAIVACAATCDIDVA